MKYQRFEDLPCWKAAMDLASRIYTLTRDRFFSQPGDLSDQLRRAALSVSNNIAEGFERGSTAELLAFLYGYSGAGYSGIPGTRTYFRSGKKGDMLLFQRPPGEKGDTRERQA